MDCLIHLEIEILFQIGSSPTLKDLKAPYCQSSNQCTEPCEQKRDSFFREKFSTAHIECSLLAKSFAGKQSHPSIEFSRNTLFY